MWYCESRVLTYCLTVEDSGCEPLIYILDNYYDHAKWVWTRIKWKSSFQLKCMPHIWSYTLEKTPYKWDLRFHIVLLKTIKYKGNWMLLLALSKVNISEFRLIWLDHITIVWILEKGHLCLLKTLNRLIVFMPINRDKGCDLPGIYDLWWSVNILINQKGYH